MTIEEQLNQKQAEVHFLQMRLKNQVSLVNKIKEWLNDEVEDNLEQEYEELNLVDLVKMKFTLQAHTQAIIQLIKKKKGGKVKTVSYTYEKRKEECDGT